MSALFCRGKFTIYICPSVDDHNHSNQFASPRPRPLPHPLNSIGSNDLTQLTLGCDRDSGELVDLFDEDNPAVKTAIRLAIEGAHRHGLPVGLCGQAPSDKPDFAAFLVENGIESISLTPDSVLTAVGVVADAERKIDVQGKIKDALSKENAAAAKAKAKVRA